MAQQTPPTEEQAASLPFPTIRNVGVGAPFTHRPRRPRQAR